VCFSQLQLHRVLRDFVVLSAKHKDKDYFTVLEMATAPKKSKELLFKSEKPKARQQEEQGHKNRNDIDERLARYKKAGLMY
jgi:hypothetical protein